MDKLHRYYVYFVSNKNRTTFYVGVTNSLSRRANEHEGHGSGFTTKYNCHDLVYFESFRQIEEAIAREKQLKNWKREWKLDLIKSVNPELKTLEPE